MQDGFVLALFVTDLLPAWHVCPSSFSALPVHYSPPWLCVSNSYTACLTAGGRGGEGVKHTQFRCLLCASVGERTRLPWRLCARHIDRLATDVRIFADAFIPTLLFMVSLLTLTAERPSELRNPHSATLPTFSSPPCLSRPTQKSSLIQDFQTLKLLMHTKCFQDSYKSAVSHLKKISDKSSV